MSHLSSQGFRDRPAPRSTTGAITAQQPRGLRMIAAALLSSLCVMSCFAATAHADPDPPPVDDAPPGAIAGPDDFTVGGWKLDNHWTYDEVLANKAMTSTIANVPAIAARGCSVLTLIPRVGPFLAWFCRVHIAWARGVARDAQANGRCFRWVIPAHQLALTHPSSYTGGWCR